MLLFGKENLVVLAVPKTGTTALEGALAPRAAMVLRDPPEIKHTPLYRYNRFLRPMIRNATGREPELMAVVRHPVEWLGSWWRYRARSDLDGHPNSTKDITFDAFVLEYAKEKPAAFAAVGRQSNFVLNPDGTCGIDHLFRYEAQPAMLAFLAGRLGPLPAFKQLNVSPRREVTLSAEVEARLRAARPDEFRVWEMAGG